MSKYKKAQNGQEMDLFINADALKEPGQTLQNYRFRHVKSIVERTSCEFTPQKCVGWYNHTMTCIPDCLARIKIDGNNGCSIKTVDSLYYILFLSIWNNIVFLFFRTYEIKVLSIEVTYNFFSNYQLFKRL